MTERDLRELWAIAVENATREIDRVAGDAVGGGFMEPTIRVHVGTILWADKKMSRMLEVAEGERAS